MVVPRVPVLIRFTPSDRGSSAVEFAVIFPVLMILMLMGVQVVNYVNAVRRIESLAASMSETLSQATPPSNATTVASVSATDLHFYFDSALVIFPYLMQDAARQGILWWQDIDIDFASIQFTAIPGANCSGQPDQSGCYTAKVVWTSSGTVGSNYRPCIIPQVAQSNTAAPSSLRLPASIFGPGSIIAVDVVFTFTPTFGANLLPSLRIARSVFLQPRYATLITYNTPNDGIAQSCP